jgi:hypothetical protein
LKSHLKRKANLVVKSEGVSKINSRGRRNLDHPIVKFLVKHQNFLFMKEHQLQRQLNKHMPKVVNHSSQSEFFQPTTYHIQLPQ